jgi:hypothetical protein
MNRNLLLMRRHVPVPQHPLLIHRQNRRGLRLDLRQNRHGPNLGPRQNHRGPRLDLRQNRHGPNLIRRSRHDLRLAHRENHPDGLPQQIRGKKKRLRIRKRYSTHRRIKSALR